jgi:AraC-like DNA-binding protein
MVMRAGAVALIGPKAEHESWVLPGKSVVRQCLHFDWNGEHVGIESPLFTMGNEPYREDCMHPVDPNVAACLNRVYWPREVAPVRSILVDAFDRLAAGDPIGESLLYPVLLHLRAVQLKEPIRRMGSKIDRAMLELKHYIDVHFAEPLTLELLSERARLSPSHLVQVFRKCIGMPPNKYLNHLRIEHACRLLRLGQWNVSEVAQLVGFTDNNYFCRFFKQKKGVSPGAYMRQDEG